MPEKLARVADICEICTSQPCESRMHLRKPCLRTLSCCVLVGCAVSGIYAQTRPPKRTPRETAAKFSSPKPVSGLPPEMSRSAPRCDADGATYFSERSTEDASTGNVTS